MTWPKAQFHPILSGSPRLRSFVAMSGWMLLFLMFVANSRGEDSALRDQRSEVSSQLLSLQGNVRQKDLHILKLDEVISDLQRQLQGVKAAELETELKKKEQELFDLKDKIQNLQLNIDRQGSEFKHLEIIAVSQQKQLEEVQHVVHLVEELILDVQAQVDRRNQDIHKVYAQWIPHWAAKDLAYWQVAWRTTLDDVWKRIVHIAVCGYKRLHDSKLLKHLHVLEVQILAYIQRTKNVLEAKVHAAWESCKSCVEERLKTLQISINQSDSSLQPYLFKLTQYFTKVLKYGIKLHLELQRKIRKVLQKNSYLASKESREFVWFLASALLILPLYGLLLLSSFWSRKRVARAITRRHRDAVHLRHAQR